MICERNNMYLQNNKFRSWLKENNERLLQIFGFISIVYLLFCFSYTRFIVDHNRYYAFFRMSWDPTLFPHDLLKGDLLYRLSIVFFKLIGFFAPIVKVVGEKNFLFTIFFINNIFVLLIMYKTAMLFDSRSLAVLFVILLFSPWQLFPGADISVVYAHHLSQTAFAVLPALIATYFFITKKYLFSLFFIALTFSFHLKTAFAIGLPIGICILGDLMYGSKSERKKIISNTLIMSPLFLILFYHYLTTGSELCRYAMGEYVIREHNEADIFYNFNFTFFKSFNVYIYILIHFWIFLFRKHFKGDIELRILKIIIIANLGLFLGALISLINKFIMPIPDLIILPWPKIAMLSTYFSVLLLLKCLFLEKYFLKERNLLRLFIIVSSLAFALLNVNIFRKFDLFSAMIVIFLFSIFYPVLIKLDNTKNVITSFFAMLLIFATLIGSLKPIYQLQKARKKTGWREFYRVPYYFETACCPEYDILNVYDSLQWINKNHITKDEMILIPVAKDNDVEACEWRAYSDLPFFVTNELVHNTCSVYEEFTRHRAVLREWFSSRRLKVLLDNKITYLIVRKKDINAFMIPDKYRVYENREMLVYKLRNGD